MAPCIYVCDRAFSCIDLSTDVHTYAAHTRARARILSGNPYWQGKRNRTIYLNRELTLVSRSYVRNAVSYLMSQISALLAFMSKKAPVWKSKYNDTFLFTFTSSFFLRFINITFKERKAIRSYALKNEKIFINVRSFESYNLMTNWVLLFSSVRYLLWLCTYGLEILKIIICTFNRCKYYIPINLYYLDYIHSPSILCLSLSDFENDRKDKIN